jgi:hypothetical protein
LWIIAVVACAGPRPRAPVDSPRVANLHAFARLYGVVRWFHPSDAAAVIDWDRFAVEGVRDVLDAPDARALRDALARRFAPIAPTVHVVAAGEAFPDEPALHPGEPGLDVVSWQHLGYGDSAVTSISASKRRHRPRLVAEPGPPYGAVWQAVDATPYRGARLRLRGQVRTAGTARGRLWVRVERGSAVGFSDRMSDRPIASPTWQAAEIVGTVDADATRIVFGAMTSGLDASWYDSLELTVQAADGRWTPLAIPDADFEAVDPMASWHPGVARSTLSTTEGWTVQRDADRPFAGHGALRIAVRTRASDEELFADAPRPGETVDLELGSGLRARVPIALYSRGGGTIGDDPTAARRSQATARPAMSGRAAELADVIVAWNVLDHFWPYWDVTDVDWLAELDRALRDALDDRTIDDHVTTLRRLGAAAPDGHARVTCPGAATRFGLPFVLDVIEDQLVVVASGDPAVQRGDVIVALDGRPARPQLAALESLASGSPQFRRVRARFELGTGPDGSALAIRLRRDGVERAVSVARRDTKLDERSHPPIERLEDGTYYVNLAQVTAAQLEAEVGKLASAPGVVFDVRERPQVAETLLPHLLREPDTAKWMGLPHVIRPDHVPPEAWKMLGWDLVPAAPRITGRVAFLVGPEAASYPESLLLLVAHYRLGEIVGSATAGANGNLVLIAEPSGCTSSFTGVRVTHGDGTRFHGLGVPPTIPVTRTIAGIRDGRDEVLERALRYLRGR